MASLTALLDRVHDEFPAVPEVLALRALSDSIREFCTRAHVWIEPLTDAVVAPGSAAYSLIAPTGLQSVALKEVRLDGRRLYPIPSAMLMARVHAPQASEASYYAEWHPGSIELDCPAKDPGVLTVKAAVAPITGDVDIDIPDHLMNEYGEAIAMGAKLRLVRQASQPWYNPDSSLLYGGPFYAAINAARAHTMSSRGEASMRVEMRSW